jgi:hypothetical protein
MISVTVVGDTEFKARLDRMPAAVHDGLVRSISKLSIDLQMKVRDEKLSGQVLKNRTGTLRRSIVERVDDGGTIITGIVGSDTSVAKYGAAHEYGFQGTVTVRAHARRITQAFGRPIAPKEIEVSAHSMRMNLPERSFLRSSLHEMEGQITDELTAAVGEAIA